MENHYKNLKDYAYHDTLYSIYQENPNMTLNEFEKFCIQHVEDVMWALNQIDLLNNLVKELSTRDENKTIKS